MPCAAELFGNLRVGGDLRQPRPPDEIAPRWANGTGALVARSRGRPLASEPILGVVAPQPAIVEYPLGLVVDHGRVPLPVLAGADRQPVAASCEISDGADLLYQSGEHLLHPLEIARDQPVRPKTLDSCADQAPRALDRFDPGAGRKGNRVCVAEDARRDEDRGTVGET